MIWFGFLLAYQLARGVADRRPALAFANGVRILHFERDITHRIVELAVQRLAESSHPLLTAAAWTYWNSEFTVVGLALLWVYLRRHEHFGRLRNTVLLANMLGLIGYVLEPTAPPRMFPRFGFTDTLDTASGLNHGSGLVQLVANPYAAMPSLHSADALIVAVVLASSCRRRWTKGLWMLWPGWVWFCVIATANHFVLDVLAGIGVALISLAIVAFGARLWGRSPNYSMPFASYLRMGFSTIPRSMSPTGYLTFGRRNGPRRKRSTVDARYLDDVDSELAEELGRLLTAHGHNALAEVAIDLRLTGACQCNDAGCASFYAVGRRDFVWIWRHRVKTLTLRAEPVLSVDVIGDRIVAVEVFERPRLRQLLRHGGGCG